MHTTEIALCTRRKMPIGRKQDGWNHIPAEARFDVVAVVKIKSIETEVVEYKGKYYSYLEEKFAGRDIFVESHFEIIKEHSYRKHMFGPPLTPHGYTCQTCGIHGNSTDADKECSGD